jgi:hypothetical protein
MQRDSTEAYNQLAVGIQQRMMSTDPDMPPIENRFELEESSLLVDGKMIKFSEAVGRVTDPKQLKALYSFVESPTESDDDVKIKLMEMRRNGDFYGMPYPDLAKEMVGLNKQDMGTIQRMWDQDNRETEAAERAKISHMQNEIYRQYEGAGLVKTSEYGKETARSKRLKADFITRLGAKADQLPKDMRHAEVNEWIKEEVAQEVIRQKKEKAGMFQSIKEKLGLAEPLPEPQNVSPRRQRNQPKRTSGRFDAPVEDVKESATEQKAVPRVAKEFKDLSEKEQDALMEAYKEAHSGKSPKNVDEINKWQKSR